MTAAWKQKGVERLKRKNEIEQLNLEVMTLKMKLADAQRLVEHATGINTNLRNENDELAETVRLYNRLRRQEIMVPTKEGFKLLTGDELDRYCLSLAPASLYAEAISKSMRQTQQELTQQVLYMAFSNKHEFNTGSESKEKHKKDVG